MIAPVRMAAAAAAAAMIAAPALADPLQDRLVASMRTSATDDVAFTQTTRIERTGAAPSTLVTRYDPRAVTGQRWTLASVDGRAPTAKEAAQVVKAANGSPTPSYARLGAWFATPATRVARAAGSATYRFARLPAGTLKMGSHDASAGTLADAVVNTAGAVPYVERVSFTSTKPFRMMLVAKVDRYVVTTHYAPLPDGRVFPTASEAEIGGAMMGKSGSFSTRVRYGDVRAAR